MSSLQKYVSILKNKKIGNYICSTHFWGPVFNWGIPIAAVADIRKDPQYISGKMTTALCVYSAFFMRFAWKVEPQNLLLFSCHLANVAVQVVQLGRFVSNQYSQKQTQEYPI